MSTAASGEKDVGSAYDVALVGSGLSSSFTLIRLLDQIEATPPPRPLRLAIVEKADHFFTGVPYGRRSGLRSLIITPVKEFIPSPELEAFMAWLAERSDWAIGEMERLDDGLTSDLLGRCKDAIRTGDCREFHLPRRFFGAYLADQLTKRLDAAERSGRLVSSLIQGEVTDIRREGDRYLLQIVNGQIANVVGSIRSKLVVLALGTPPGRVLLGEQAAALDDKACLVEDPYDPGMEEMLGRAEASMRKIGPGGERRALIIGANATCLETLFNLNDHPSLRRYDWRFYVMAPQGRLPDRFRQIATPRLDPAHLNALQDDDALSTAAILEAVRADLAEARAHSFGISDTLPVISSAVNRLVGRLSRQEKEAFVRYAGIEIGRLQRRAGDEYSDVADDLVRRGRLEIIGGRFVGLDAATSRGVAFDYEDVAEGVRRRFPESVDLVVNCSGSAGLRRPNASPLINSLLVSGLCRANASGVGFAVNDKMEVADNLFLIGPLLAGNVIRDFSIWHVEHCGRIIDFSEKLARNISESLLAA